MDKLTKAKLVLMQIEAVQSCEKGHPIDHYLALVNEVFRDAKQLAEAVLEDSASKAS